jgi:LPS O-antigen subunit length determinant protein (WzzB/FepE family)
MRPGSRGWDTHEKQMQNQQKALRERLKEMEKRHIKPPKNAWKMATVELPKGNQRRVPGCVK